MVVDFVRNRFVLKMRNSQMPGKNSPDVQLRYLLVSHECHWHIQAKFRPVLPRRMSLRRLLKMIYDVRIKKLWKISTILSFSVLLWSDLYRYLVSKYEQTQQQILNSKMKNLFQYLFQYADSSHIHYQGWNGVVNVLSANTENTCTCTFDLSFLYQFSFIYLAMYSSLTLVSGYYVQLHSSALLWSHSHRSHCHLWDAYSNGDILWSAAGTKRHTSIYYSRIVYRNN